MCKFRLIEAAVILCAFLLAVSAGAQDLDVERALRSSRQRIDAIDDQIVKLLNDRAKVVREVGLIKKRFQAPVNAPGRAEQVLRRVAQQAQSPLTPEAVRNIYEKIISELTAMEKSEIEKTGSSQ